MEWTTELTVGFVPLPPEKEEAYWEAIHILAEILYEILIEESINKVLTAHPDEEKAVNGQGSSGVLHVKDST